jgi:hypothetical protein
MSQGSGGMTVPWKSQNKISWQCLFNLNLCGLNFLVNGSTVPRPLSDTLGKKRKLTVEWSLNKFLVFAFTKSAPFSRVPHPHVKMSEQMVSTVLSTGWNFYSDTALSATLGGWNSLVSSVCKWRLVYFFKILQSACSLETVFFSFAVCLSKKGNVPQNILPPDVCVWIYFKGLSDEIWIHVFPVWIAFFLNVNHFWLKLSWRFDLRK